ncbi:heavy metal-associated isoprenylated plant protein 3-like [Syzygium oleosum]|uniref:heavy metal-associated isoprenylated plant protein 3-like n=1 Tax=Syzygium oleosum TaxID=219896 RepID=UPI0024B8D24C|nr:heavy metal-associated isoprenylated plant protein 3-like [Syzygium oleosum]XP_056166914.1 heavy metal-associated isoprenylated plant protein 3-like [Syzygium oleosum]
MYPEDSQDNHKNRRASQRGHQQVLGYGHGKGGGHGRQGTGRELEGQDEEGGEIVLPKKEKKGGEATDKEGGGKNKKGGDYHKAAEITGGWGKAESQRMEFQRACGYGHCAYGERTRSYAPIPYAYYQYDSQFLSDENPNACSVM